MTRRPFTAALLAAALTATAATAAPAAPLADGGTRLVGVAAPGQFTPLPRPAQDSDASGTGLSADGRFVAFSSFSDGLLDGDDDRVRNIYVKDRLTGAVELISRKADGSPADGDCRYPTISDDGMRVAFVCAGSLVGPDTNGPATDVFVRDRAAQTTALVSSTAAGVPGTGSSSEPMISGNGLYVAFSSYSTNLAATATPGTHVYRKRIATGALEQADVSSGGNASNGMAWDVSISDDGNRVAFVSTGTNHVAGATDANGFSDVYLRDFGAAPDVTLLVSRTTASATTAANGSAGQPAVSGDGTHVAFTTTATNSASGDTDATQNIHRRQLAAGNVLIDREAGAGGAKAGGYQFGPAIDTTGNRVAFASNDPDLAPGATGTRQIIVRDHAAATTTLVSRGSGAGAASPGDEAGDVALSGDGTVATFRSTGLTTDAAPSVSAVFARELGSGTTTLVSRPPGGEPLVNAGGSASLRRIGALSVDGRYAVYTAAAAGLPGSPPGSAPRLVWRRDNLTGEVVLVSRGDGADGAPASGDCSEATISAYGERVAFRCTNGGLVAGVPEYDAGYVRDLAAGTTVVASRAPGGGVAEAEDLRITPDGRRVAFMSDDPLLGADAGRHVFVRDLAAGSTTAVAGPAGTEVESFDVDGDGSHVTWESYEPVESDDTVWIAAVGGGAAQQVDVGPGGPGTDGGSPSISWDAGRVAFATGDALLPADTNGTSDAYVHDLATGALLIASRAAGAAEPANASYAPVLSGDGRRVAFESGAVFDLADGNGVDDIYVRDLAAGSVTLASRGDGAFGAVGTARSGEASLDAAGGCVLFASSSALVPGLSFGLAAAYLRASGGSCPVPVLAPVPVGGGGGPHGGHGVVTGAPLLSALRATPKRFRTTGKKPGTTLRFSLDRAARVRIAISRVLPGHRVGKSKRCRKGAPKRGAKPSQRSCRRLKATTSFSVGGVAGANRVKFNGRAKNRKKGKRLARGRYVAVLTATDATGSSKPREVTLTVR